MTVLQIGYTLRMSHYKIGANRWSSVTPSRMIVARRRCTSRLRVAPASWHTTSQMISHGVAHLFDQRHGFGFRLDLQFFGQHSTAAGVRA